MTKTKQYVLVCETDYYGPRTVREVVTGDDDRPVDFDTLEEAKEAADRLSHNQCSPARGRVAELTMDHFRSDDWTTFEFEADLWEAAATHERNGVEADEALNRALDECEYILGVPDRDGYHCLYRIL